MGAFTAVQRMLCPEVVGRSKEIELLTSALDGLGEDRGSAVFLVGEPGIGKSRLADEAAAEANRRGVWVLYGRASPTGRAVPYQSMSGALLYGLRTRPLSGLADLHGVRAGLATLLPGFVEGPAVDPSPVLLGETVLRLAAALGGDDGALIVLEDLHWACGDTLAITEYLADNAAMQRLVVMGTSRPEGAALGLIDSLDRRGSAAVRMLPALSSTEVARMTGACLSPEGGDVPAVLSDVLGARAEGLPFLVEELLAGLVNGGKLVASPSGWELTGEVELDVPLSFAETVRERLALLSVPDRRMVETAAVLGRDFDWTHLPRVAHQGEAEVLDALSRAVDLQLVEETGGDRFQFRHVLTVEAILDELLVPQRARLAAQMLDDLVEDPSQMAPELLELAAHLAAQAGRRAEAVRYLTEEARHALASGAFATATATARRARGLLPPEHPDGVAAGEVLLSALSRAGNAVAVDEVGRALLSQLAAVDATAERRARVLLVLAKAAHATLDLDRAREFCEQALALEADDDRLTLEIDLALAGIGFRERQYAAAVATAERVLADADRRGFDDLACEAMYMLGRHHLLVTFELGTAKRYFDQSVPRAERSGRRLWQVRILHLMAYLEFGRSATPARIEQARALAEELGSLEVATELDHVLAVAYLVEHRLDRASESAERALAAARRYRLAETAAVVAGVRATIEAARGHRAEAERQVDEAITSAQLDPLGRALVGGTALVLAALVDDDLPAAARRVAETRALLPQDEMLFVPPFLGMFHALAAVVVAAAGAQALVEGRDWVRLVAVFPHSSFRIAQAIVAGRAGDTERAAVLFAEGDEALAGAPWLRALYRRYAGECAVRDGWGEPAVWLAEAEAYFEDVGNEPLARACRSLLRLAGTSPRRQRAASLDSRLAQAELTTREADVLALLAQGLTNKEIAGRLYLSPRTVEKHVERILTKTGQQNRTALAAYATEQAPVATTT